MRGEYTRIPGIHAISADVAFTHLCMTLERSGVVPTLAQRARCRSQRLLLGVQVRGVQYGLAER